MSEIARAKAITPAVDFCRSCRARASRRWCRAGDRRSCRPTRAMSPWAPRGSKSASIWRLRPPKLSICRRARIRKRERLRKQLAEQKAVEKETDLPKARQPRPRIRIGSSRRTNSKKPERKRSRNSRRCRRRHRRIRRLRKPPRSRAIEKRASPKRRRLSIRNRQGQAEAHRGLGTKDRAYFELHKKYPPDRKKAATVRSEPRAQPTR